MCARAFWTVFPCGSSTAFFGVIIIFAFMLAAGLPRLSQPQSLPKCAQGREFFQISSFGIPSSLGLRHSSFPYGLTPACECRWINQASSQEERGGSRLRNVCAG